MARLTKMTLVPTMPNAYFAAKSTFETQPMNAVNALGEHKSKNK